jgi:hypothetical protein
LEKLLLLKIDKKNLLAQYKLLYLLKNRWREENNDRKSELSIATMKIELYKTTTREKSRANDIE